MPDSFREHNKALSGVLGAIVGASILISLFGVFILLIHSQTFAEKSPLFCGIILFGVWIKTMINNEKKWLIIVIIDNCGICGSIDIIAGLPVARRNWVYFRLRVPLLPPLPPSPFLSLSPPPSILSPLPVRPFPSYYSFLTIIYCSCLFLKTWRVYHIINSSMKMEKVTITKFYIMRLISVALLIEIVSSKLLLFWIHFVFNY